MKGKIHYQIKLGFPFCCANYGFSIKCRMAVQNGFPYSDTFLPGNS